MIQSNCSEAAHLCIVEAGRHHNGPCILLSTLKMPDRNAALVLLIPVPQKDSKGMPVPKARKREATHRMLIALGSWFGSATALPSWGSWKAEPGASLSIDRGQTVLLVMTTPGNFRRHRPDLVRLLQKEGIALNQEQMAAIAFRSARGSVLIQCKT